MNFQIGSLQHIGRQTIEDIYTQSELLTFQHSPEFLDFHKDRFKDHSVVIYEEGKACGYLFLAEQLENPHCVESHPGATFGGIVGHEDLFGEKLVVIMGEVKSYLKDRGFKRWIYRHVPAIYGSRNCGDVIYSLFRNEAFLGQAQLSLVLDLRKELVYSKRKNRNIQKCKNLLVTNKDKSQTGVFWRILEDNLKRKYQASPVHSLDEILDLMKRFDNEIELYTLESKVHSNEIVAGILVFKSRNVWKTQYIASDDSGNSLGAINYLVDLIARDAREKGILYFDLGTSNQESGLVLNESLYQFKREFGGFGMSYERYEFVL